VTQPLEESHLLFAMAANRMVVGKACDKRAYAGTQLKGELWCRRPYEGVDVVARGLGHAGQA
jgi:hypothetical protein